jgi:predicted nicotinamide N-methyase
MNSSAEELRAFIRGNTELLTPPLIPEIKLYLASEVVPLWQATEEELAKQGLPPPFWAFAWAGGQALARFILDEPEWVAGKRVFSFAAGSGLEAIASAKSGAVTVAANEIDPYALASIELNAKQNECELLVISGDQIGSQLHDYDVIIAGDVCYEQGLSQRIDEWLQVLADAGKTVLIGDPKRTYFNAGDRERLRVYAVQTTRELEDTDIRNAGVWKINPRP